jgi:hypothetical protein
MTYEIVKNKLIPEAKGGRPTKYPLADMAVGDAFCVGAADGKLRNSVAASCRQYTRRYGATFTTRCVDGDVWVWRTA